MTKESRGRRRMRRRLLLVLALVLSLVCATPSDTQAQNDEDGDTTTDTTGGILVSRGTGDVISQTNGTLALNASSQGEGASEAKNGTKKYGSLSEAQTALRIKLLENYDR